MVMEQALARSRRVLRRAAGRLRGPGEQEGPGGPAAAADAGPDPDDVRLLLESVLFDPGWYAAAARCSTDPERAARHYLRQGTRRGLWPHPLFVPERVAARAAEAVGESDPLVAYLRERLFDVSAHPLFDVGGYLRDHPEAVAHAAGPLGHYVEHGAAAGFAPNRWYTPDPDEPGGLADWAAARWRSWDDRRRAMPRERVGSVRDTDTALLARHADPDPDVPDPRVTVVVEAGRDADVLAASLRSVAAQRLADVEVLVVTDGAVPDLEPRLAAELPDLPLTFVRHQGPRASAGLNLALGQATGELVGWLQPGDTWEPGRVRLLAGAAREQAADLVHDILRVRRDGKPDVFAAAAPPSPARPTGLTTVDLGRMLVRRTTLAEVGGFDESLPGGWAADLSFRLLGRCRAVPVPAVGATRDTGLAERARDLGPALRPVPDHATVPTWTDVAFNRYAVDWDALAAGDRRTDLVSVVIPTYEDFRMTRGSVASVMSAGAPDGMAVECLVLDNGSGPLTAQVLDSLERLHDGVTVLHVPANLGFALGNNLALRHARGARVVFLNNDTVVQDGWLGPLVRRLEDPDVRAAQSLLLYPSGAVQCAGIAFPDTGGLPYPFLNGFPVEDAAGVDRLSFAALTGAALAMRFEDVVALRGFDPLFRNGMEDVDLCLRLAALRPGRCVVEPASVVTHLESRTPGRFKRAVRNRRLFLDRWRDRTPRDDTPLWADRGFEVVDHEVRTVVDEDRRLCTPEPVLVRAPAARASVAEGAPRLRWAIKNPATPGEWGDWWGDTHFAGCLAASLRSLGQEVVIDRRDEFHRRSGHLDDVVLTLRGRSEYHPSYGQVSLMWVISHPEMVSRAEATAYDRVLAASTSWSARMSGLWGLPVEPLLQATEPELFHPDRAEPDTGHEVLFVGGSRGHHRRMVQDALEAGLPLSVYGKQWEDFLPARYLRGEFVPNDELGAMYAAAGVVLNDHWDDMRVDGFVSNRLFDAAACGARVVTDDVAGLDGLFGASVQVVRDARELAALVRTADLDAVFGSREERRAVAERVRREHSFLHRARRLLDVALEVRAEQDARR
jgi:GT2 family glycosyltransferase